MIGYLALNAPWRWGLHRTADGTLEPDDERTVSPYRLHGYPKPTVFKTVRNAMRTAGPQGYVLVLDLHQLPLVHLQALGPDDIAAVGKSWVKNAKHSDGRWDPVNREWIGGRDFTLDELVCAREMLDPVTEITGTDAAEDIYMQHQLAERQSLIWHERLAKLTALIKRQGPG